MHSSDYNKGVVIHYMTTH